MVRRSAARRKEVGGDQDGPAMAAVGKDAGKGPHEDVGEGAHGCHQPQRRGRDAGEQDGDDGKPLAGDAAPDLRDRPARNEEGEVALAQERRFRCPASHLRFRWADAA